MLTLVWFKRDLRIDDHAALYQASQRGAVLPLYIIEPDYWQQPDTSLRQWDFIAEALVELDQQLRRLGQPLLVQRGPASQVIRQLCQQWPISAVYSHEETGNLWSYQRDLAVRRTLQQLNIPWQEFRQFAVFRPLANRDDWFSHANAYLTSPLIPPPQQLQPLSTLRQSLPHPILFDQAFESVGAMSPIISTLQRFRPVRKTDLPSCTSPQRAADLPLVLQSFFQQRCVNYQRHISLPAKASQSCSRLSPYLSYGMLSLRALQQQCWLSLKQDSSRERQRGLTAFFSRLRWHCHFMQKLEDAPVLEVRNMHTGFDGMREFDFCPEKFRAFCQGQTGYPLIDAAMRSLLATGWLHFRGRAMLVSFATYHLWLHWRPVALHLAQCFVDYEPGIHYPQIQMQAGTTAMNPYRMYNPLKQSQQKDPDGAFIRYWCPELSPLPDSWLHQPWLLPDNLQTQYGVVLGRDYPRPIVALEPAMRAARQQLSAWKKQQDRSLWQQQKQQLVVKHASRKGSYKRTATRRSESSTQTIRHEAKPSLATGSFAKGSSAQQSQPQQLSMFTTDLTSET